MAGIQQTKELLTFVIKMGEALDKSLIDGDIGFRDINRLVAAMLSSKVAFEDMGQIPHELTDLTDQESESLSDYVKQEFQLSDQHSERMIECSLEIGLKFFELVEILRKSTLKV
ncbi:MAG: hypothetical protein AB8C84_00940 [Oligoflexales bacterium]